MPPRPALLGGQPLFEQRVPIVRPVLPEFSDLAEGIRQILESRVVTKGRFLAEFESAVANHLGVKHAVAVSSCTSGLILTHRALELEGEVITPSFTFMATVGALLWNGLRPVFADVDAGTANLAPEAAEAAITPNTSAILAVHNFGNPAEIDALEALARRRGLKLIFDAAHGFGSLYQGKPLGPQGEAQVFSLSPTKLLITGEGGIVATNNDELAARVRIGREYGNDGNYDCLFSGLNARMPEINALLGLHSLAGLDRAARSRNETAALYQEILGRLPGIGFQQVCPGNRNSYREFSITVDPQAFGLDRDQLALALTAENIDTRKYYEPPAHRQTAFRRFFDGNPLPNTEWLASNSLSLPMWTHMDAQVSLRIGEAFQRIHAHARAVRSRLAG